jgi:ATP-binding cassette, subfamily F, member 3
MDYTGTVVFVSHDRYFIDKLATRVFEIGGGKVEVFPGNYEDYLWRKEGGQEVVPTLDDVPSSRVSRNGQDTRHPTSSGLSVVGAPFLADFARPGIRTASEPTNGGGNGVSDAPKKKLNPIKRKQMEDRVQELEQAIERAEAGITQCETALQNFVSAEETERHARELGRVKAEHAALLEEWGELSQSLQES